MYSASVLPELIGISFPLYWERRLVPGVLSTVWITQPDGIPWHQWAQDNWVTVSVSWSICVIIGHRRLPHSCRTFRTKQKSSWLMQRVRDYSCYTQSTHMWRDWLQTDVEMGCHFAPHTAGVGFQKCTLPCRCRYARNLGAKQIYCRGNLQQRGECHVLDQTCKKSDY